MTLFERIARFLYEQASIYNFYKKKIVRQFDVRSHETQDLGDTRLFQDNRFADLKMKLRIY